MSEDKNRRKRKKFGGKSFIILPIIFFIGIYLIAYVAFGGIINTVTTAAGLFFSDTEKDYSTEYKNIFVPVPEPTTVETSGTDTPPEETTSPKFDLSEVTYPNYGQQFGELIIEDCDIDVKLFFGDGNVALRNGVGVYNGSFIPGYGKTILVAGHNNTYFNGLKYAKEGQIVKIRTSYGNYTYKITSMAPKKANDSSAYDLSADYENLIMYTCYPFDELGLTSYRYFVYADYVSGPTLVQTEKGDE